MSSLSPHITLLQPFFRDPKIPVNPEQAKWVPRASGWLIGGNYWEFPDGTRVTKIETCDASRPKRYHTPPLMDIFEIQYPLINQNIQKPHPQYSQTMYQVRLIDDGRNHLRIHAVDKTHPWGFFNKKASGIIDTLTGRSWRPRRTKVSPKTKPV